MHHVLVLASRNHCLVLAQSGGKSERRGVEVGVVGDGSERWHPVKGCRHLSHWG